MKFGVNTLIWGAHCDGDTLRLLPTLKEHGFDGVEVPMFGPAGFPASDLRKELERNELECTVSTALPRDLSLISDDAAVRRKALDFVEDCIKLVAEAGARLFAGPIYSPVGLLPGRRRTPSEWQWAVEGFHTLGPVLKQYDVGIAIEPLNRFETYFLNTAADAAALCDEINDPAVGVLFDTFHANIEEKTVGDACRALGRHLKHVHTCENDRGIPGSGHVDWPALFEALRDLKYDGWLTIESFGFNIREIAAAAAIWRDLAPAPESIAFEGIRFLKQLSAFSDQLSARG